MKRTITMLAMLICFAMLTLALSGCQIFNRIFGNKDETWKNENRIATLEEQLEAVDGSIDALKLTDTQLRAYIDALKESGDASEKSVNSLKTDQAALENRIAALENLKNTLATKEWAEGTFATLEQQQAVQGELDALRASIATVQTDMGEVERKLQSAIAESEEDIKSWVNKEFYTKSDIDAKLVAIESSISDSDGLKTQIEEQKTALADAKSELTAAYRQAITDAIKGNDGVIDTKISDAIAKARDDYDAKINNINARFDALTARVDKNENNITDILARLEALEAENKVLKNQIRCLKNDHDWDETKTTLAWNDDLSACDLHVECLNCEEKFDAIQSELTVSGNMLTAKFDDMYKREPQTLDLTDTTVLKNSQIKAAVGYLVGDGTADSVDISLRLSANANGGVFDAIRNGLAAAKAGSVNLTLNGAEEISASAFRSCAALGSVTLGTSVKTIGSSAFITCTSLDSVAILGGVEKIHTSTFYNCSSLTSVTIPSTVTAMYRDAFGNCKALESIYYEGDLAGWCGITFDSTSANPCFKKADLYIGGELLTEVTIPESVDSLNNYAFAGCTSITKVTIPDNVKTLGDGVFGYCPSLKTVTVSGGVGTVGKDMFYACEALDSVTLAEGITTLESGAFYECVSLESITFPSTLTTINKTVFSNSGLTSLTLPNTVKTVGESAFQNCKSLKSVKIGSGITKLPKNMFNGCVALRSVTIPSSVTEIGSGVFYSCGSLASISIPDGVTTIGGEAFYSTALAAVTVPNSVTSIGNGIFSNCRKLETVVLGSGISTIGEMTFQGCAALESITFRGEITSLSRREVFNSKDTGNITLYFMQDQHVLSQVDANSWGIADGASYIHEQSDDKNVFCGYTFKKIYPFASIDLSDLTTDEIVKTVGSAVSTGYTDISVSVSSEDAADSLAAINSALSNAASGSICLKISGADADGISITGDAFYECNALGELIIGDGVNVIHERAFRMCTCLKSLTIEGNVNAIDRAFDGCRSLENVTISGRVTTIEYRAFSYSDSLLNLTITGSVRVIDKGAFEDSGLKTLTITGSVNRIERYAFLNCVNLTEVTLPRNIQYLGEGIFEGCTSLTDGTIDYAGTAEAWQQNIIKNENWNSGSNITKVRCTDQTLSGSEITE